MLPLKDFQLVVQLAPLFSIDFIVLNDENQVLIGKRKNAPAKGYWFVPGGRVFKNEPLAESFRRISLDELGYVFEYQSAVLLGLYDHFYNDSVFNEAISTHYINASYLVKLTKDTELILPSNQHQRYRWVAIGDLEQDATIHGFSKVFLNDLIRVI